MKKIKRSALIIAVLLLVVVAIPSPMHAESLTKLSLSAEAESWYYPVLPGDEEWNKMSLEDIIVSINMPQHMIACCSTEKLASLVLDCPLLINITLYDFPDDGIAFFVNSSNIFKEFFNRTDCLDVLLEKFSNLNVDYSMLEKQNSGRKAVWGKSGYTKELFLQIFFGNSIDRLNVDQKEYLVEIIEEKYEKKTELVKSYATSMFFYSCVNQKLGMVPAELIPENILSEQKFESRTDGLDDFVSQATDMDGGWLGIRAGSVFDLGKYYYYGNTGTYVTAYEYESGDFVGTEITNKNNEVDSSNPYLIRMTDATIKFNCHSYAWTIPNASMNKWYIPNVDAWMSSTYVSEVGNNCAVNTNDIIVIKSGNQVKHSAIASVGGSSASDITVVAKMGLGGVYRGKLSDMMSAYGNNYSVYR